jgi:hypothetical protein
MWSIPLSLSAECPNYCCVVSGSNVAAAYGGEYRKLLYTQLKSEFRRQLVSEPESRLAMPVKPKYEKAVLSGSSAFGSSLDISETN